VADISFELKLDCLASEYSLSYERKVWRINQISILSVDRNTRPNIDVEMPSPTVNTTESSDVYYSFHMKFRIKSKYLWVILLKLLKRTVNSYRFFDAMWKYRNLSLDTTHEFPAMTGNLFSEIEKHLEVNS
jgi:hypothetical protein